MGYKTNEGTEKRIGVSAEELASVTAQQAFEDATLTPDGKLNYGEFKKWFEGNAINFAEEDSDDANNFAEEDSDDALNGVETNTNGTGDGDGKGRMAYLRRITKLNAFEAHEVFEIFTEMAPSTSLTFSDFLKCFNRLIRLGGGHSNQDDERAAESVISRLFEIFDEDGNGVVDARELASGLSILCSGSRDEKVRSAFSLFDYNGDGYISLEEMTRYLTSVFRVLYESSPETKDAMDVSAEELGRVTAEQAFVDCDLNHDGRLSLEEFKLWYLQSAAQ